MAYGNDNGLDFNPFYPAAGGAIGGALGSMFGNYENPANSAMPYFNQIPGMLEKYLSPYVQAGQNALPQLEGQYGSLLSNPGGRLNEIGANYQQSPGFKFALQQALQGASHSAASQGMAGSPQDQQQQMQLATNLANQDYNNWIQNALGLYGQGLSGQHGIYNTGAATGVGMGEDLASMLANQARLAYEGQNAQNQHEGGMFGSLGSGLGSLVGLFLG